MKLSTKEKIPKPFGTTTDFIDVTLDVSSPALPTLRMTKREAVCTLTAAVGHLLPLRSTLRATGSLQLASRFV